MSEESRNPENGPESAELSDAEISSEAPGWAQMIKDVVDLGGSTPKEAFVSLGLNDFTPRTVAKIVKGLRDLGVNGLPDNDKPAPVSEPAKTSTKERGERKEKGGRQFKGYRLVEDGKTGAFVVQEDFEEQGVPREQRTSIVIPPEIAEKMKKDEAYRADVLKFCEELRREIGRSTNIYFDESKEKPGDFVPKWKSPRAGAEDHFSWPATDGRKLDEHLKTGINPDVIPTDVLDQVKRTNEANAPLLKEAEGRIRSNPKLWEKYERAADKKTFLERYVSDNLDLRERFKLWHNVKPASKWIGLAKQRKREDIISADLAGIASTLEKSAEPENEPAPIIEGQVPANTEVELEEVIESEAAAEAEKSLVKTELRNHIAGLLFDDETGALFGNIDLMPTSLKMLRSFANSFLKNRYLHSPDMAPSAKLSSEEVSALIRETMRTKFADNEEVLEALKDDEPTAVAAEAQNEVAQAKNEVEGSKSGAEKEAKFSKAYKDLRPKAADLNDEAAFKRLQDKLAPLMGDADADTREAAQKLYNEIERGQIGEFSETRMAGLWRSRKEAEFFSAHPLIDRRNIELLDDGRMKIYLDRTDIEKSLERAVRDLVLDSMFPGQLDPKPDAVQEELVEKIVSHLLKDKSLGNKTGEITITKPAELPSLILKLAQRLNKKKD